MYARLDSYRANGEVIYMNTKKVCPICLEQMIGFERYEENNLVNSFWQCYSCDVSETVSRGGVTTKRIGKIKFEDMQKNTDQYYMLANALRSELLSC